MPANRIIIICSGVMPQLEMRPFFDDLGINVNNDYLLFNVFGEHVLREISPNIPQLVLTSYVPEIISAFDIAERIKEINSQAIVFAFTFSEISVEKSTLDGVIKKMKIRRNFPSEIARMFLNGCTRENLIHKINN